jgi:hypothetical protein
MTKQITVDVVIVPMTIFIIIWTDVHVTTALEKNTLSTDLLRDE